MMKNNLIVMMMGLMVSSTAFARDLKCKAYGNDLSAEIFSNIINPALIHFSNSLAWHPESKTFEWVYSETSRNPELHTVIVGREHMGSGTYKRAPQVFRIKLGPISQDQARTRYGTLEIGDPDFFLSDVHDHWFGKNRVFDLQCF